MRRRLLSCFGILQPGSGGVWASWERTARPHCPSDRPPPSVRAESERIWFLPFRESKFLKQQVVAISRKASSGRAGSLRSPADLLRCLGAGRWARGSLLGPGILAPCFSEGDVGWGAGSGRPQGPCCRRRRCLDPGLSECHFHPHTVPGAGSVPCGHRFPSGAKHLGAALPTREFLPRPSRHRGCSGVQIVSFPSAPEHGSECPIESW